MRFGSVCSGIEAASHAWEPLGFTPAWFSEVAPFPSKFLAHRFPHVPNYGSLVGLADRLVGDARRIDLLVGGTPCQSFSVAGLRGGLSDDRGNLALELRTDDTSQHLMRVSEAQIQALCERLRAARYLLRHPVEVRT